MKTTKTTKYQVWMPYGLYFCNVKVVDSLKEAWDLYRSHKEYIMADGAKIERIEITTTRNFFKKSTDKVRKTVISWER